METGAVELVEVVEAAEEAEDEKEEAVWGMEEGEFPAPAADEDKAESPGCAGAENP